MSEPATYTTLLFDVYDNVARITLNRPQAANTLSRDMAAELYQVAVRCAGDPAIRAVVLTGTGSAFCAGGDLKSFAAQDEQLPIHLRELLDDLHAAISHLANMDAPVIAAVNGVAAGAGMSLMCACDIAVAAESARFTMAYTRAGLSPDASSTFYLPRLVGLRRALDLALTNRMLSAQEALDWGLVTRVVPDAALADEVERLAGQLANGATRALGAAKRLLRAGWDTTLETQMTSEMHSIAAMARTSDAWEGIRAFVEKRPPRFTGE
jgi:2-(1,2-epoxy-1,2-dihydrophenyl)acetyl-CoA isomerase